jgi:glycosyltransferase involved in cell wall biosynthesis
MVRKKIIFDFTIPGIYNAGIRSWSFDLLNKLRESGLFDIEIVTPVYFKSLDNFGKVVIIPYQKIKFPLIHRFWYYETRLKKYMEKAGDATVLSPYFQLPPRILKNCDCVVTVHDTLYFDLKHFYKRPDLYLLIKITNYYHNLNIKYAKQVITVSSYSRDRLKYLFNLECLDIFYNTPQLPSNNIVQNREYIVYFGGWEKRKRADLAMKIAYYILKNNANITFVVSGVKNFKEISSYFTKELHDRIIYCDRFSKESVNEYLSKSILSIYTSAFEGFGIPIIESQLFGVPVLIGSDLEITREIPLYGIIKINLDEINDFLIKSIMKKLEYYDKVRITKSANDALNKMKEHNNLFSQILYNAI